MKANESTFGSKKMDKTVTVSASIAAVIALFAGGLISALLFGAVAGLPWVNRKIIRQNRSSK